MEPYKEQESQAFAYTDFGPAGKVTELKPTQFGDIKRYQFENGVMLNVKPTDLEINTVYLTINFGQGLLGFNEHDAPLGSVFAPAIILSGVNKHTMDELQEMFGGSSLSASLKAQYNSFVSEVALDSLDVFDQLRFSTALLTDNGYRKEGWESAVRQWADFLASYESEPNSVLGRQSSAILHGGDNRWSVHSLEQVRRLSIKDAKSVLDKAIKKGPVEISLVSDISFGTGSSLCSEYLWCARHKRASACQAIHSISAYIQNGASDTFPYWRCRKCHCLGILEGL